jgi:hypothetical protein
MAIVNAKWWRKWIEYTEFNMSHQYIGTNIFSDVKEADESESEYHVMESSIITSHNAILQELKRNKREVKTETIQLVSNESPGEIDNKYLLDLKNKLEP